MEIGKKQVAAMLILLIGINALGFWLWQSHQTVKIPPTVLEKFVEVHKDSDHGAGIYLIFNEKYQQKVYMIYGFKGLVGTTYYFSEDGSLLGGDSGPLLN